MFIGGGSNGKSVIASIWSHLMGSYSVMANRKFLVVTNSEPHPEAIAKLRGRRLVIVSEVPPGARFAEDLVKQLTGEDVLTGRFMGENSFDFQNQMTLFFLANHLPSVPAGGYSFFRRARKIDFDNTVKPGEENPKLISQLIASEGPGILAWMIKGASEVISTGKLIEPKKVALATKQYQFEEDYIGRFLADTVEAQDGMSVPRLHVYELYRVWAIQNGLNPINAIKFSREVLTAYPTSHNGDDMTYTNLWTKPAKIAYAKEDRDDLV